MVLFSFAFSFVCLFVVCCQEEVTNLGRRVQHLARTVKPRVLAFTEISSKCLHLLRTTYGRCRNTERRLGVRVVLARKDPPGFQSNL